MRTFALIMTTFLLTSCCCSPSGQSTPQLARNFINRQHVSLATKENYRPKNPKHVTVYSQAQTPLTPYRIIGVATISKYNLLGKKRETATLDDMMKNLAASVGGDALINVSENADHIQANIVQFERILI